MKKIFAMLPQGYDWFYTVENALAFGLSAALAIRIIPALLNGVTAATTRSRTLVALWHPCPGPFLKVFGQRR